MSDPNKVTDAQKDEVYKRLPTACDLSWSAVTECLRRIGASSIYHVTCGKFAFLDMKALMQLEWQNKSPFCPVVNYTLDEHLQGREWYIKAVGIGSIADAYGTEGV